MLGYCFGIYVYINLRDSILKDLNPLAESTSLLVYVMQYKELDSVFAGHLEDECGWL